MGPARGVLAAHRRETAAISIITLSELAEGFAEPRALVEFLAPFRVVTPSRAIAWRTAALQSSLHSARYNGRSVLGLKSSYEEGVGLNACRAHTVTAVLADDAQNRHPKKKRATKQQCHCKLT
jgi:hypothetical protein